MDIKAKMKIQREMSQLKNLLSNMRTLLEHFISKVTAIED